MMNILFVLVLAGIWGDDPGVSGEQFAQLVRAQTASLKDLAVFYEGELKWVGPVEKSGVDPDAFAEDFQGSYVFRRDGACLLDVYVKDRRPTSSVIHRKVAHLGGKVERLQMSADAKQSTHPERFLRQGHGGPGSLSGPQTPYILFHTWHLLDPSFPVAWGYEFQGWEAVDGRRCLRFQVKRRPNAPADDPNFERYWVDVERNCSVLRAEYYNGSKLSARIDEVALLACHLSEKEVYWVPVRARMRGFEWNGEFQAEPFCEETIRVVDGSALLNQGLPDLIFSVKRSSGLPQRGELERLRSRASHSSLERQFQSASATPKNRTDPASISKRIDERLAQADQQAKQLEASSPARETWSWSLVWQLLSAALGTVLLVGAGVWKWKYA